ncbi:MAG TPA: glycosyltransferase [Candidatus Sulfotelmatobacter sp.]|nr:glycosyltransferase [Candidatus Sulfotelmatobacter sp.]
MSSLTDNQTQVIPGTTASTGSSSAAAFSDPVFLMINTLETGGTERQFVEVTRALRADGVPVHLGCVRNLGAFAEGLGELAEFRLGGSVYGWQSLRSRWQLRRHLRKLDVAVAHAFDFYANLTLIPAARLAGVPVVIGSHRQLGDLLTPRQFQAQLAAFRMCDRVVCNSQAAAQRLLEAGLAERKVVVIGNALPADAFADAVPALDRAEAGMRIGMIARMNAGYKNHRGFMRAAKRLSGQFANLEFVLAGDGPLRTELEKEAAELGIGEQVRFLGDRRDVAAVLAALDISVVPSSSESLSNVMLESMAAGVPVVATAVGGNCEIGGDGRAVLVSAEDDEALAAGLARVLEERNMRSAMARRARDFVRTNFSAERICRQYEELYADTLRDKRWRSRGVVVSRPIDSAIRVALVAPSLQYVGGQAVQADLLMQNWKGDAEVAPRFVAVDPRFPMGLAWAERVPVLRTVLRTPIYAWQLWRGLRDVDMAHIFSASYTSFLVAPLPAWIVARLRGKKTLINYRSGEGRDHLRRSWIARRVLKNTDLLVVPSGYLVDVFREFGLEAQVVPNLVDVSQFQFRERRPVRPHLVCTRGCHPYYGIDVVVRAFAEVQKSYPEAQLDLAGGGRLEGDIRELVRQLHLTNVNFLGAVSRQEIGRVYDRADIFVNASNLDNMPVSVLEAFAAGTPVVTTEPEGMGYIVAHERTGLLSAVGDAGALARNILRVLREPELAAGLAHNALAESVRYSWGTTREQWLGMYAQLMRRSGEQGRSVAMHR